MSKHVVMIIANSPNPSYFRWFAALSKEDNTVKLSFIYLNTIEPPQLQELQKKGFNAYWYYFNYAKSKPLQYLKLFIKLFFLFKQIKPDVVQTNLFDDSLPALFAAKIAGVKKRVLTKQDTGYHIKYTPKYIKYDILNNKNATHIIPVSKESEELIIKFENPEKNKMQLIHHGVDEDFFNQFSQESISVIKSKFNLDNKKVIGIVSRYIELKGYIQIIEAAPYIIKKFPDVIFVGIGWGPQKESLENLIKEKNIGKHFILTDKFEYQLMPSAYQCFDIFIHAAEYEPFGFVIAEAMFTQKPIITTKVGAARDILSHLDSAYILNSNNPKNIEEGLEYMLSNNTSELAKKANQLAHKYFTKKTMWNNYKKIFTE